MCKLFPRLRYIIKKQIPKTIEPVFKKYPKIMHNTIPFLYVLLVGSVTVKCYEYIKNIDNKFSKQHFIDNE
jgi:hypothetical protein